MSSIKTETVLMKIKTSLHKNFRQATLGFIFIIAFVNVFQMIFGAENSIVGVIFAIMMSASMARDLTSTPVRHFFSQALVLILMAVSACLVNTLPPFPAFLLNLIALFAILYTFTYEYATHLYFPYILSYLFLIFISPVGIEGLPKRLLGMVAGAFCIILYQMVKGRKRMEETAVDVLNIIINEAEQYVDYLLSDSENSDKEDPDSLDLVHENLCKLSRLIYERRKRKLQISSANFAVLDTGRGLEHLILMLSELEEPEKHRSLIRQVRSQIELFRDFVGEKADSLPILKRSDFLASEQDEMADEFFDSLSYIRNHMVHMADPEQRDHYHPTAPSFAYRLQAALDASKVRITYALRVSLLLALGTLFVRLLGLPHGKWLLFTMGSVSLPYADDVPLKAKKRFLATLIGGGAGALLYALIPWPAGRTAIMMASGYVSYYLSDYTGTFACSTIGALGGAVFMSTFGPGPVGTVLLIRIGYVCLGIAVAWVANCLVAPFKKERANAELLKKYEGTAAILTKVCNGDKVDPQFYYNLVIQGMMMEEKLQQNVRKEDLEQIQECLKECREAVRNAHRDKNPGVNLPAQAV